MKQQKKVLLVSTLLFSQLLFANEKSVERAGDIVALLIPAVTYANTFYMQDKEGRSEFYKSFGGAAVVTLALKYSIKAQRPDESDDHSFPSTHATVSFQSATFLHKRYGIKSALIAYGGATFVAFSRVYAKKHYTRDVIAGALIGSVSSWFFTDRFKDVTVSMQYEKSYKEIKVSYRW